LRQACVAHFGLPSGTVPSGTVPTTVCVRLASRSSGCLQGQSPRGLSLQPFRSPTSWRSRIGS